MGDAFPIIKGRVPPGALREPLVHRFNEFVRLGKPFNQKMIAESAGVSGTLISMYCSGEVIRHADALLAFEVTDNDSYAHWRTQFLALRSFFNNTPRRTELWDRWLLNCIEHVHRQGRIPTYKDVKELSGGMDKPIRAALDKWSAAAGIVPKYAPVWKPVSLDEILTLVDPVLHRLPLTFLEDPSYGRAFTEEQCRMMLNLVNPDVRNHAFFVMAFADQNRINDIRFFNHLDTILIEMGYADLNAIEPDSFYAHYHDGKLLESHAIGKRFTFLQTYFRLLRRQKDYLRKLTAEQQSLFEPFLIRAVRDDHFWRTSTLARDISATQRAKRKAKVAVVHSKFYQLRELAERRMLLVVRLRDAVDSALAKVKGKRGKKFPIRFEVTEEIFHADRSTEVVTFRLALWNGPALREYHLEKGDRNYYDHTVGSDPNHPSRWSVSYFLTYDPSTRGDPSHSRYWFTDLLRAGGMGGDALKPFGMSQTSFNVLPRSSLPISLIAWQRVLREHTDLELIPLDLCMTTALIGNAALQVMTKTGARANEFLQIRLTKEHLLRANLPSGTEAIAFYAKPKGRPKEEPFYIDERALKALYDWWKYRRSQGQSFVTVNPTRIMRRKLSAGPYLWQVDGAHLDHRELNAAILFLLFDVPLEDAHGKRVELTSHLLRHSFATEMRALNTPIDVLALLMKQSDTSVTDYYSQPTPSMLAGFQRRIFEGRVDLSRTHRRTAPHLWEQLKQAMETVGAMAPVVGGTCTVANACPSGYACMGCFGNVPDPAKRAQVEEYRSHYERMAVIAGENLPHEKRKSLSIVSNCDDMLAEMDSLESTDAAARKEIALELLE